LFSILLQIVLPRNEREWLDNFKKMVKFRKLPRNQHENEPDSSHFDDWFNGSIEYIYEANDIVDLLASIPDRNFTPIMQTYNGQPGLIQLFYDQIPMQLGRNINAMIDSYASKACKTLREYTALFQEQLQKIQDTSDDAKLSRSRLSRNFTLTEEREINRFNNTTGRTTSNNNEKYNNNNNNKLIQYKNNENFNNNGNNNNNNNNKYNNFGKNNNNNQQMIPYKNPHEGRLHSLESQVCDEFYDKCDVDDYDEYIRNLHDYESYNKNDNVNNNNDVDDNSYDYEEVFGIRPDFIEGISPGFNVTRNLNAIDNVDSKKFPCFDEINNKCLKGAKDCKYSHDVKDLQKEAIKRYQDAEKSKYLPREYRVHSQNNIPTTILKRDHNLRVLSSAEDLLDKDRK
jgi:hypothetical protein